MNKTSLFAASGALAILAAACVPAEPGPTASSALGEVVDVRAEMQQHINPAMLGIWDVTNNAMNDEGAIDPALMDAAKWRQVAAAAEQLAQSGLRIDRKSTRLNSSHVKISYAVFCLEKKCNK